MLVLKLLSFDKYIIGKQLRRTWFFRVTSSLLGNDQVSGISLQNKAYDLLYLLYLDHRKSTIHGAGCFWVRGFPWRD